MALEALKRNGHNLHIGEFETEPANKKSRGNEVKIGERRGEREEKKGYSKQTAAKASIKKSGSSTAC